MIAAGLCPGGGFLEIGLRPSPRLARGVTHQRSVEARYIHRTHAARPLVDVRVADSNFLRRCLTKVSLVDIVPYARDPKAKFGDQRGIEDMGIAEAGRLRARRSGPREAAIPRAADNAEERRNRDLRSLVAIAKVHRIVRPDLVIELDIEVRGVLRLRVGVGEISRKA